LTADQRAADVPCGGIERHPLRQWREVDYIRAQRISVGRSSSTGGYCAARIRRALCSAWARSGCDYQRTARRDDRDGCRRSD
jgi:hypothetical protein